MDRTLKRLKEAKGPFSQVLETLEADPVCCGKKNPLKIVQNLLFIPLFSSSPLRIKHTFLPDVANAANHSSPLTH